MARLRIRVELSRAGMGVPLQKLTAVTGELHKFLNLLSEDIHVDRNKGEWLVFDFDHENLNFTAEYVGAVDGVQLTAFNSAFDGATSLRRDTIAQFLHITQAIGEDEVIGFGLYQSDDTQEPTEWRCLSRRDALRMADEVQLLMGGSRESHLPAVGDPALGARMFGDRRDRSLAQTKLVEYVREVEHGLTNRLQSVETKVEQQSVALQDVRTQAKATETSFKNLLSTFESFCDQATQRIEHMGPAALSAPADPIDHRSQWQPGWLVAAAAVAVTLSLVGWASFRQPDSNDVRAKQEPVQIEVAQKAAVRDVPAAAAPVAASVAPPSRPLTTAEKTSEVRVMQVELDATAPSWISLKNADGVTMLAQLLVPGSPRTVALNGPAVLRAGNAGGVVIRLDGKSIGPIGPEGGVREVSFKDGSFTLSPTK